MVRPVAGASSTSESDVLRRLGGPVFFPVSVSRLGLRLPPNRHGQSVRVWARSLAGMQKEAVVASARTGAAWRVASDEGPYLEGHDAAPCPLAFMSVGMVAGYLNQVLAVATGRGISVRQLELIQDNRYTMEGSALAGTMTGGALPVELEVRLDADGGEREIRDIVSEAVAVAPVTGMMREAQRSLFSLTANGQQCTVDRVTALDREPEPDPGLAFQGLGAGVQQRMELVTRVAAVTPVSGVEGGAGSSLQAEQRRQLHVWARCRRRADGLTEIEQRLYRPLGSTFHFLSHEPLPGSGSASAPDAASYVAVGVAFCFMTQLGRYATIKKQELSSYRVVQDLHLSVGEAKGRASASVADPVETHLYLETPGDPAFGRQALDMAEQTCFLHAFCRTPLEPVVTVTPLA